jgi:protein TonB
MRRVRRVPQDVAQAAFTRLTVAMALSATLHLYLIYGLALQRAQDPAEHLSIINARLVPEPTALKPKALAESAMHRKRIHSDVPQAASLPEPERMEAAVQTASSGDAGPEREVAVASLPDPVHYAAKELDVYPQPLNRIEPAYPQTAFAAQIVGSVTLLILIDEFGRVTEVSVVEASPQDVFEESARSAVAASAYSPAQKNGRAVRSRILVKVDYDPAASSVEE